MTAKRKLTDQDRKEIKELLAAGNSIAAVADALGWSYTTVYFVKTSRNWADYYDRANNARYARTWRRKKRMEKGAES